CSADELGTLGIGGDNEPGIYCNAMPTDARARLENVHAGVVVGKFDKLPNVDSKLVGNERKLIGESDVDVAERVLCKFCHLSSYIIGWEQLSIAECRVNSSCTLSSLFRLP